MNTFLMYFLQNQYMKQSNHEQVFDNDSSCGDRRYDDRRTVANENTDLAKLNKDVVKQGSKIRFMSQTITSITDIYGT